MKKQKITKSLLQTLSTGDLIDLAKQEDLFVPPNFSRVLLINELLELDIDIENLPYKTLRMLEINDGNEELQSSYGKTEVHILLCDPIWCFAFWDVNMPELERIMQNGSAVQFFLRVMSFKSEEEDTPFAYEDVNVKQEMRSCYIHISTKTEFTQVSLCYKTKTGQEVLAKSNFIYFPRRNIQVRLSAEKTEVDEVMNLSGLQYLRLWHYNKFKVLFDEFSNNKVLEAQEKNNEENCFHTRGNVPLCE